MTKPKSVDSYIATAPAEIRGKLKELRATIKKAVPEAVEKISYGMPYYAYKGRLAYFRHWKNHVGLYIPTPTLEHFAKELHPYVTAKATVQFPHEKKLPLALITKIVKARAKANEARRK